MIDAIIFDGEGVVIDSEGIWDHGQREFLRRRGFVYDRDRIKPLLTGTSVVEGVRVLQREYGFEGDVDALARERIDIVRELFELNVRFVDGFVSFFEAVRARFKTCIATSMDEELLRISKRRLGLERFFGSRIFSLGSSGCRPKPEPDLFLYAAEQLGSVPAACLVIEDSPYGVEAARRAGMDCIGLATTYPPERLADANLVVRSFAELDPALLPNGTSALSSSPGAD